MYWDYHSSGQHILPRRISITEAERRFRLLQDLGFNWSANNRGRDKEARNIEKVPMQEEENYSTTDEESGEKEARKEQSPGEIPEKYKSLEEDDDDDDDDDSSLEGEIIV